MVAEVGLDHFAGSKMGQPKAARRARHRDVPSQPPRTRDETYHYSDDRSDDLI
jgi:hypothetical protein